MPKRLETAKEQIDFAQKTAASEEVNKILQEIAKIQGELRNYPAGSQQYNYLSGKISELRNSLQSVVQQTGGGLTYEDLSKDSPLLQNLRLPTEQFGIPEKEQIRYPSTQELQGLSEQDRAIAESEAERARGEVVDFAERRIPEEIQRTQQEREDQARIERAEQLRSEKEKQKTKEQETQRVKRDLIQNPVWENLQDKTNILGSNGPAGSLTTTEERVITNMLRSAPYLIKTDERFDEFMADLFDVVEQSRSVESTVYKKNASAKTSVEIDEEKLSLDLKEIAARVDLLANLSSTEEEAQQYRDAERDFWHQLDNIAEGNKSSLINRIFSERSADKRNKNIKKLLEKGFIEEKNPNASNIQDRYVVTDLWVDYLVKNAAQKRIEYLDDLIRSKKEQKRIKKEIDKTFAGDPVHVPTGLTEKATAELIAQNLTANIEQMVKDKYPEITLAGTGTPKVELPDIPQSVMEKKIPEFPSERYVEEKGYDIPEEPSTKQKTVEEEFQRLVKGDSLSPSMVKMIEETTGLKLLQKKPPSRTIRDEQDIPERTYEAYKIVQNQIDQVSTKIEDLVQNGYGDLRMGTSDAHPEGIPIESLSKVPGHQFIRQWMQKAYGIDDAANLQQKHLPTNQEAMEILSAAQDILALREFVEEGGRAEKVQRKEESSVVELALAKAFKNSAYQINQTIDKDVRGREREAIKDEANTIQFASQNDPLYNADFDAWLDQVDVEKMSDMGRELTQGQRQNAKTWYTYDWWFQNVFDGEGQTFADRIKSIRQNPEDAIQEAEGRYEEKLETAAEQAVPLDLKDFGWMNYENVKDYFDANYPNLSDAAKRTQYKLIKKQLLLQKIAEFMKSDPEIREYLNTRGPTWRDAMGQYLRDPIGRSKGMNIPDVGNVIFSYIAMNLARNANSGLQRIENLITVGNDPAEAIRKYIRGIAKFAIRTEMRKQEATLRNIRTVEIDKAVGEAAQFLNSQYADDDPESLQATQIVRDAMTDDPENVIDVDTLISEIIDTPYLMGQSGLDSILRTLSGKNAQLWAMLYGASGPRDIWSDAGTDQGKKLRLDAATREWEKITGERLAPDAFRKRKQRLVNLAMDTVAKKIVDNPELSELMRVLKSINAESAAAQTEANELITQNQKRIQQADLPTESGFEQFEGTEGGDVTVRQESPIAVNEPTDADQLERVEKMRRKRPKKEF